MQADEVRRLVREELNRVNDAQLKRRIQSLLVEPHGVLRDWDYGLPGQRYLCWTVLEHAPSNTGVAYCPEGFGPQEPWGLVFLSGEHMSIGMDAGWYRTLEDAFRESAAWDQENPPGYEVK